MLFPKAVQYRENVENNSLWLGKHTWFWLTQKSKKLTWYTLNSTYRTIKVSMVCLCNILSFTLKFNSWGKSTQYYFLFHEVLRSHHEQQNPCHEHNLRVCNSGISNFRNSAFSRAREWEEIDKDLPSHWVPGSSELHRALKKKKKLKCCWKYYFLPFVIPRFRNPQFLSKLNPWQWDDYNSK